MKTLVTGTLIGLALASLGGLLAGFVPSQSPRIPEVRGRLFSSFDDSRLPLSSLEQDAARLAGASSGRMSLDRNPVYATAEVDAPSCDLLQFDGPSVSFLTNDGLRPIYIPGGALAILPMLPPGAAREDGFGGESAELLNIMLEVAVLAGDGEALASDGRPLRWAQALPDHAGPVCSRPLTLPVPTPITRTVMLEPGFHSMPMLARATRYQDTVEQYARKFGLDSALVLAIMQTESGFNPSLVSTRQAHGLMQVVPGTAGDEVHRWMGRSGMPTSADLLNPDNNIRYGMAYLHLLRTRHLDGISDPRSQEYCVIAAYNGGSGAVLRHFGRTKTDAVAAINAMTSEEVLARLINDFPARETRLFVSKVLSTRSQFMAQASRPTGERDVVATHVGEASAIPARPVPLPVTSAKGATGTVSSEEEDTRAQLLQLDRRLSALQQSRARTGSGTVASRS